MFDALGVLFVLMLVWTSVQGRVYATCFYIKESIKESWRNLRWWRNEEAN